jgi:hypothetical protein
MTTAAEKKAATDKAAAEKTAAEKFATDQAAVAARFTTKRKLVMPLLKMQTNVPIYVKPLAAHFTGKDISKGETDEKKKRNPAELCNVVDLVTGEEVQIIVSAVVLSVWDDDYPDHGYVGKGFKITKGKKGEGKSYFSYSVDEIELPE